LMQRNLRKIQGNLETVQEDLEYTEIRERGDTGRFVIGDTERSTKDTRGDSERSWRHTWKTRRYRKIWNTGRTWEHRE
jgi:hypothetical protein